MVNLKHVFFKDFRKAGKKRKRKIELHISSWTKDIIRTRIMLFKTIKKIKKKKTREQPLNSNVTGSYKRDWKNVAAFYSQTALLLQAGYLKKLHNLERGLKQNSVLSWQHLSHRKVQVLFCFKKNHSTFCLHFCSF